MTKVWFGFGVTWPIYILILIIDHQVLCMLQLEVNLENTCKAVQNKLCGLSQNFLTKATREGGEKIHMLENFTPIVAGAVVI